MKTKIEKDNDARMARLKGLNHLYVEELTNYLRSQRNKNFLAIEETVADIIDDVADAQSHGLSARDFYGKDAQGAADAILATIPNASLSEKMVFIIPICSMLAGYLIYPTLLRPQIRFGSDLFIGLFVALAIFIFMPRMDSLNPKKAAWAVGLMFIIPVACMLVYVIIGSQLPVHPTAWLSTWPVAATLLVAMPVAFLLMTLSMHHLRAIGLSWLTLACIASLVGFLIHYSPTFSQPHVYISVNILLAIAGIALFIWQIVHLSSYREQFSQVQDN